MQYAEQKNVITVFKPNQVLNTRDNVEYSTMFSADRETV